MRTTAPGQLPCVPVLRSGVGADISWRVVSVGDGWRRGREGSELGGGQLGLGEPFHPAQAGVGGDLAEPTDHLPGSVFGVGQAQGRVGTQVRAMRSGGAGNLPQIRRQEPGSLYISG